MKTIALPRVAVPRAKAAISHGVVRVVHSRYAHNFIPHATVFVHVIYVTVLLKEAISIITIVEIVATILAVSEKVADFRKEVKDIAEKEVAREAA